jgi:hypothetical protein
MNKTSLKHVFLASLLVAWGYAGSALAYYSAENIPLDAGGGNPGASDYAAVTCYDNGNGAPHHFSAALQDLSAPVPGLFVSLHIFKDTQMTTVTDSVSADGNWSPIATVAGGPGVYYLSVRKTNTGVRNFTIGWECQTADFRGTGTDISVLQVQ